MAEKITEIEGFEKLVVKSQLKGIVSDIVKLLHDEDTNVTNAYKALVGELGNKPLGEGETEAVPHTVKSFVEAAIAAVDGDAAKLTERVKAIEDAKGVASGYASLDENGHVPSSQLPSFVDDVIEAANKEALPTEGETGKIYVTLNDNLTYRWSGSQYVEISQSLALGETDSTAYAGDKGKKNAEDIAAIVADYLKAADKTELSTAIGDEKTRAEGAEKDITDRLDIIEGEDTQAGSIKKALKDAKDYADGLAGKYDKNGAAAAVQGDTTLTVADLAAALNSAVMTDTDVAEIKALIK